MKLSIVIPIFNESATIEKIAEKVCRVELPVERELVLVDDFSTDGTRDILAKLASAHPDWHICYHDENKGKGAALKTGFAADFRPLPSFIISFGVFGAFGNQWENQDDDGKTLQLVYLDNSLGVEFTASWKF